MNTKRQFTYKGKKFANKEELCNHVGMSVSTLNRVMRSHEVDYEEAISITLANKKNMHKNSIRNNRNAKFVFQGKTYKNTAHACRDNGISPKSFNTKISEYRKKGKDISKDDLLSEMIARKQERIIVFGDEYINYPEVASYFGIRLTALRNRIYAMGIPLEAALVLPLAKQGKKDKLAINDQNPLNNPFVFEEKTYPSIGKFIKEELNQDLDTVRMMIKDQNMDFVSLIICVMNWLKDMNEADSMKDILDFKKIYGSRSNKKYKGTGEEYELHDRKADPDAGKQYTNACVAFGKTLDYLQYSKIL